MARTKNPGESGAERKEDNLEEVVSLSEPVIKQSDADFETYKKYAEMAVKTRGMAEVHDQLMESLASLKRKNDGDKRFELAEQMLQEELSQVREDDKKRTEAYKEVAGPVFEADPERKVNIDSNPEGIMRGIDFNAGPEQASTRRPSISPRMAREIMDQESKKEEPKPEKKWWQIWK